MSLDSYCVSKVSSLDQTPFFLMFAGLDLCNRLLMDAFSCHSAFRIVCCKADADTDLQDAVCSNETG